MDMPRPAIIGLIIVVIAGGVAWYLAKSDGASPRPAETAAHDELESGMHASPTRPAAAAPRSAQEPELQAPAADAENPAEVPGSNLDMRTLANCHADLVVKKHAERRVRCDDIPPGDSVSLNICRSQQTAMSQQVLESTAAAASCPAVLVSASAYYEAMKSLAVRGDLPAQRCFIQGYFASSNGEGDDVLLTDEQTAEYPKLARKFIDDAFERGDWSVVNWLGRVTLNSGDVLLSQAYPFGGQHLGTAYRMQYLLMLGNHRGMNRSDPRRLTELWRKEQLVTPEQIEDGQRWAREMFDQHFNGSQEGAGTTEYNFCERR